VTAGPLRARYADGELRDIRIGSTELIRRIYVVFQDRNWTARPWIIEDEQVDSGIDEFSIAVQARGTFDAGDFTWRAVLVGDRSGSIAFDLQGSTGVEFWRNRLGLCILHPPQASGDEALVEHVDGSLESTAFPDAISPHQPFLDMRALTHQVAPGLRSTLQMAGEVFESEDHRNWSDASFKHYCTPISLPFPVRVSVDQVISQSVRLTLEGADDWQAEPRRDARDVQISIGSSALPLPRIGIQLDADGHRLTPREQALLSDLRLDHVRVDLEAGDHPDRLQAALQDASGLKAKAVVALIGADPVEFAGFREDPRIDHWLVFDPATKVTDPGLVEQVAQVLGPRVGGGTNLYFTELNRGRPSGPGIIAFSINPQVHASDDESVMQNAMTCSAIARNARSLYPDARLEISPITLRPRFNPNATAPEVDFSNTPLPSHVDARQCQPFAAAWTVLALKAIAESGCIDSVTAYRATGWEGLVERAEGSPQPADFPSRPGEPFPVYGVLRDLADARHVIPCTSSDADRLDALALDSGLVLLANLTAEPVWAAIEGQRVQVPAQAVGRVQRARP